MEQDMEMEYRYQTVVNIVADMIVEFLKATRAESSKGSSAVIQLPNKDLDMIKDERTAKAA